MRLVPPRRAEGLARQLPAAAGRRVLARPLLAAARRVRVRPLLAAARRRVLAQLLLVAARTQVSVRRTQPLEPQVPG